MFLSIKSLPNLLFGVLCLPGDQTHPFAQPSINPLACCICWACLLGCAVFPPWNEGPNFGSYMHASSSLEKWIFRSSAHFQSGCFFFFFFLRMNCMSCQYILTINPLSIMSFANIFSHSINCLLFCQQFPLPCKSFFGSHLFTFAFISFALRDCSKIIALPFLLGCVLLMSSSRSFMASCLTLRFF